jgi:hypothetical protein
MRILASFFTLVPLAGALALVASMEGCRSRAYNKQASTGGAFNPQNADREPLPANASWDEVRVAREKLYSDYLMRTEKGPNGAVGEAKDVNWFHSMPLGLQGIPQLVLQVAAEAYPDIWGTAEAGGIGSVLGVGPHPMDFNTVDNNPKGAWLGWGTSLKKEGRHALPYGFVSYPDISGDPGSIAGTQNTFFSCAACHTSRVVTKVNGKPAIRYYMGGAGTEIEAQKFASLVMKTAAKLTNLNDKSTLDANGVFDPTKVKPNLPAVGKFLWRLGFYDCKKYRPNEKDGEKQCSEEKRRILGTDFLDKLIAHFNKGNKEENDSYFNETDKAMTLDAVRESILETLGGNPSKPFCGVKPPNPNTIPALKLVKVLVGAGAKVRIQLVELGYRFAYRPAGQASENTTARLQGWMAQEGTKTPPHLTDNRSGQMDAFGLVQGVTYLNAMRPDLLMFKYMSPDQLANVEAQYGKGSDGSAGVQNYDTVVANRWAANQQVQESSACRDGEFNKNVASWIFQNAALSDIKNMYRSGDEYHANWDGNQGAGARVLASGLSSVGDPLKVFTEIHETQNAFINNLPAPPYPFEDAQANKYLDANAAGASKKDDFYASALRGQALFNMENDKGEKSSCVSCHRPRNPDIYDTGTDINRAMAVFSDEMRSSLIALTTAACKAGKARVAAGKPWIASALDGNGEYWCELVDGKKPNGAKGYMDDVFRPIRGTQNPKEVPGYKADPLYAVWQDAPYFHNGSVPTLWELMMSKSDRDAALAARGTPNKFVRGNIAYDMKWGGFQAVRPNPADYPGCNPNEQGNNAATCANVYATQFDVTQRGNSNAGHEFFHKDYKEVNGKWIGVAGTEFTAEEKQDVLNYLKLR